MLTLYLLEFAPSQRPTCWYTHAGSQDGIFMLTCRMITQNYISDLAANRYFNPPSHLFFHVVPPHSFITPEPTWETPDLLESQPFLHNQVVPA